MLFSKAVKIESCAACHINSQGLCFLMCLFFVRVLV